MWTVVWGVGILTATAPQTAWTMAAQGTSTQGDVLQGSQEPGERGRDCGQHPRRLAMWDHLCGVPEDVQQGTLACSPFLAYN